MSQAVIYLKNRAAKLHKSLNCESSVNDSRIMPRIAQLPEFRGKEPEQIKPLLQRKHFLALLAREHGFSGWRNAKQLLEGHYPADGNFGSTLYPARVGGFLNKWSVKHPEAIRVRQAAQGFLLPYGRQFMVVSADYISALGIDPHHVGWKELDFDWTLPRHSNVRVEFYEMVLSCSSETKDSLDA